eukprot:4216775-Alexandrium_andersonii.AAC.1
MPGSAISQHSGEAPVPLASATAEQMLMAGMQAPAQGPLTDAANALDANAPSRKALQMQFARSRKTGAKTPTYEQGNAAKAPTNIENKIKGDYNYWFLGVMSFRTDSLPHRQAGNER